MTTPSRMRREGRKAFHPGEQAKDHCPYKYSWTKKNWMDGWEEAEATWQTEQTEKEEGDLKWDYLKWGCPWHSNDTCEATNDHCNKDNCAPYYFKGET